MSMISLRATRDISSREKLFLTFAFTDASARGLFMAGAIFIYVKLFVVTPAEIGFSISIGGLFGLVITPFVCRLGDTYGASRVLSLVQIWRGVGFLLLSQVSHYAMLLGILCLFLSFEQSVGPLIQAISLHVSEGANYVKTMARVSVVRNIAYSLSGALFALLAAFGIEAQQARYLTTLTGMIFIASAYILRRNAANLAHGQSSEQATPERAPFSFQRMRREISAKLLLYTATNGILSIHTIVLTFAFPLVVISSPGLPKFTIGIGFALNSVMAVLFQIRLSRGAEDLRGAARKQLLSGSFMLVFCTILCFAGYFNPALACVAILVAIVFLTLAEIEQSAGGWGISHAISSKDARGFQFGVYAGGSTLVQIVGPALLSTFVLQNGIAGWLAIGLSCLFCGVLTVRLTALHTAGDGARASFQKENV